MGLAGRPGPTNVILLIGDGMGPLHEDLASRWVHGESGRLRMQQAPHRTRVSTWCADTAVTDSAAAATAMSTGRKVAYEAVAVELPGDGKPLTTILEEFRDAGLQTGLVTTSRLTHATPAAFAAHVPNRYEEGTIGQQMRSAGVTLLFGGGGPGLWPELVEPAGYTVATDATTMDDLEADDPPWAVLIGDNHLPYIHDGRGTAPTLPAMSTKALELLTHGGAPFFLMIEGARIDHASHNNDIVRMLPEVREFDEALNAVLTWAEGRDDTLVMLTADHECGGLSVVEHAPAGQIPMVKWATGGHTGVPVSLYGWGPFGDTVEHAEDNTDIYWLSRWALDPR